MEVPQLLKIGDLYYLLFCTNANHYNEKRSKRAGMRFVDGTHYLVSENPLGPFRYLDETQFFAGDELGSLYSGKIKQNPKGEWVFMAFRNVDSGKAFVGEIIDPIPVVIGKDGQLSLRNAKAHIYESKVSF